MKNILMTPQYQAWIDRMRDRQGRARINIRVKRLSDGYKGDMRVLGGGVSEMRIHYGPGYRIYFTERGNELIVLLAGGDKDSQNRDIKLAKAIAKEIGE